MAKSKKQNKEIQISKSPAAMSMLGLPEVQIPVTPAPVGKRKKKAGRAYFRISVRDNGCGMSHDAIPNLLGRVLSGSKYGVRQTRGKFGLGAKMALIWSKKSTGVPIKIRTAHIQSKDSVRKSLSIQKRRIRITGR